MQAQESSARQSQEAELRKWAEAELMVLQHDHSSRFADIGKRVGAVEAALADGGGKAIQARRCMGRVCVRACVRACVPSRVVKCRLATALVQASFDRVHSAIKELSDRKTRELGVVRSEIEASYGSFVEAQRDTMSRLTSTVASAREEVRLRTCRSSDPDGVVSTLPSPHCDRPARTHTYAHSRTARRDRRSRRRVCRAQGPPPHCAALLVAAGRCGPSGVRAARA
jgi:hypothetical protein